MGKSLSILFLDTRPVRRGAQVFIQELKKQFEQSDIYVRRIYLYREDDFECLPLNERDQVLHFKDNHWMEKWLFFQPALYKKLAREIREFNPDIILCNGSRTLKYAALVKRLAPEVKAKWIYRVIDSARYWNNKTFTALIYRLFIIPAMDAAVGVSKQSLYDMVQHYRFKKPVISIPRAVDIDFFTSFQLPLGLRVNLGINEHAFVVLFLGNFTHQKRPDRFIEIIAEVRKTHPQIHGLMVGDGPLKKQMELFSQHLQVSHYITFTGYQQDVRSFIAISDLLMLTSDTEGMPGVVLEAAAMNKITIAGPVGGVAEFIDNNDNGYVVSSLNNENFAEKLKQVINDKDSLRRISNAAAEKVRCEFSIHKIYESYSRFFKDISEGLQL